MKKIFLSITFLFLFTIASLSQTVYVSESGKKFHKKNCTTTNPGKKGMELKQAKAKGYTSCKICNPEAVEEKKKPAVKKK